MSGDRKKGLRLVESVFGKTEEWVFDKEEKFKSGDGQECILNAKIRTKEQSKRVHELAEHMKTFDLSKLKEHIVGPEDIPKDAKIMGTAYF